MSKFFNVLRFIVVLAAIGYLGWKEWQARAPEAPVADAPAVETTRGIASGSGKIEATSFNIAARSAARLGEILVKDGDLVKAGAVVARLETDQISARKGEAEKQLALAGLSAKTADSIVTQRQAEHEAAEAALSQSTIERQSAEKRLSRSQQQWAKGAVSDQLLDDDKARVQGTIAAIAAGKARIAAADAAVGSAKAQAIEAEASIAATRATLERIDADLRDSELKAPRDGRVQLLTAQPGDVVLAGANLMQVLDIGNVSMTFFLPASDIGHVAIGNEVRIKLDAAPQSVIAGTISFVADIAELAPKTDDSDDARPLVLRVQANVAPELLAKHLTQIRTGLAGRAYVKTATDGEWPADLSATLVP